MGKEVVLHQPPDAVARAREVADGLDLAELEEVLADSVDAFIAFGTALGSILDRRLYRETHESWDDYCKERLGMSGKTARRQIAQVRAAEDGEVPSQRSQVNGTRASHVPTQASIEAKSELVPSRTDDLVEKGGKEPPNPPRAPAVLPEPPPPPAAKSTVTLTASLKVLSSIAPGDLDGQPRATVLAVNQVTAKWLMASAEVKGTAAGAAVTEPMARREVTPNFRGGKK